MPGRTDKLLGKALSEAIPGRIANLCGRTSLDEAVDLIAGLECLISNDSGLMHVAAAVDTPVVGIYGATSPESHPPLTGQAIGRTFDRLQMEGLCLPAEGHPRDYGPPAASSLLENKSLDFAKNILIIADVSR